ncbi:hypothetical protein [Actinomadura sp. DC4]|uniref:hypothetical protein n=1 Tax=Actinomadura sp. DC4 TaxID=3055069 RepID=UPI0025B0F18D|nr:hypothetical protein [Actinomadura sp. DC4]MDN3355634.1 hypothetical protein [Actinomadura sp. DC4]
MGRLLGDEALETSSVVANRAMNRERSPEGSNGYGRELGPDIMAELAHRDPVRWLDLCRGSGRALMDAARRPAGRDASRSSAAPTIPPAAGSRYGGGEVRFPYRYLGADDRAGPNYTGQPAVASYYEPC